MMRMRAYMERHLAFCNLGVSARIYYYPKQLPFPIVSVTTVPVLRKRALRRALSYSEGGNEDQKAISPSITKYSSYAGSPIRYTFSPFTYFRAKKCGKCARDKFYIGAKRGMRATACCFSRRVIRQLRYIHLWDQGGWVIWRTDPERRVSWEARRGYWEKSHPRPHSAQTVVASLGEGRGQVVCNDVDGDGCTVICPEKRQQLLYAGSQCCSNSSDCPGGATCHWKCSIPNASEKEILHFRSRYRTASPTSSPWSLLLSIPPASSSILLLPGRSQATTLPLSLLLVAMT